MPIFKLKCRDCGNVFEFYFRNSTENALCPDCKSDKLDKLPSQIAVLNKNSVCPNASFCNNVSPCCCNGNCGGHK